MSLGVIVMLPCAACNASMSCRGSKHAPYSKCCVHQHHHQGTLGPTSLGHLSLSGTRPSARSCCKRLGTDVNCLAQVPRHRALRRYQASSAIFFAAESIHSQTQQRDAYRLTFTPQIDLGVAGLLPLGLIGQHQPYSKPVTQTNHRHRHTSPERSCDYSSCCCCYQDGIQEVWQG